MYDEHHDPAIRLIAAAVCAALVALVVSTCELQTTGTETLATLWLGKTFQGHEGFWGEPKVHPVGEPIRNHRQMQGAFRLISELFALDTLLLASTDARPGSSNQRDRCCRLR
jgi:hypothetical protein